MFKKIAAKYFILIASMLFNLNVSANEWTTENTAWESAYMVAHLVDWGQTLDIASSSEFVEKNPLLGVNPTRGDVNKYFLLTGIGHYLISRYVFDDYRATWQQSTFFIQFNVVRKNISLGVRVNF